MITMKRKALFFCLCHALTVVFAQRQDILLNHQWMFRFSHQVDGATKRVDLPHTWNATDALSGKLDYKRGIGNYEKELFVAPEWRGKRLFLRFEGANSVTNVFVNRKHVGEHRGGYAAFVFEITDLVEYGAKNKVLVRVNNGEQLDVMPLVGDFNFYGGIYRDVHLLVTDRTCISPLDYASPGVYLTQQQVNKDQATVGVEVVLSHHSKAEEVELSVDVFEGGKRVCSQAKMVQLAQAGEVREKLVLHLLKPRLWNGREDPFCYRTVVSVKQAGKVIDVVEQPLGLRWFAVDPERGFFLNGNHLPLHGVCRHQDRAELGNALRPQHHLEDVALIMEMGANAIRLAHYPQAALMYDEMDRRGIITWAEIPFVGPGGYADKGFVDQPSFRENGQLQLIELIRQNYNHPSILFWGLFNELKEVGDNPIDFVKELNALAKKEDPYRLTTAASNQSGELNRITECIAWNRYDGWYGSTVKSLADFLDETHRTYPSLNIGISEYGAGASIYHQQDSLKQPVPNSWWHPENWQTYYHMENWKIVHDRPFVWGSFIWNMFDFGAAHRTEGDRPGINDKGLVTFDRKIKKDAFYFYKANWNKRHPMVYLAQKRCNKRSKPLQEFMAFSTEKELELIVNGVNYGKCSTDRYATALWREVPLKKGANQVLVVATKNRSLTDQMVVYYD